MITSQYVVAKILSETLWGPCKHRWHDIQCVIVEFRKNNFSRNTLFTMYPYDPIL